MKRSKRPEKMEGKMKGKKRILRKGLSGKILSFTMALAMVLI